MCVLSSELSPNFLSLCPWGALLLTPFQTLGVQAQAGRGEWAPAQHNQREGKRGWSPQGGQGNKTPSTSFAPSPDSAPASWRNSGHLSGGGEWRDRPGWDTCDSPEAGNGGLRREVLETGKAGLGHPGEGGSPH